MIPNSRITMPYLPHRLSVVRKQDQRVGGIVQPSCTETILYNRVPGRMTDLRPFNANDLQKNKYGKSSGHLRRAVLKPTQIPNRLRQNDYLRVYWGTPPNIYTPDNTFAFFVWLESPTGPVRFEWDGTIFVSVEGYELAFDENDGWCLSGNEIETPFCFPSPDPYQPIACYPFPDGWSFIRLSGPPVDYEIIKYKHQLDEFGHYSHTSIDLELLDTDEGQRI